MIQEYILYSRARSGELELNHWVTWDLPGKMYSNPLPPKQTHF